MILGTLLDTTSTQAPTLTHDADDPIRTAQASRAMNTAPPVSMSLILIHRSRIIIRLILITRINVINSPIRFPLNCRLGSDIHPFGQSIMAERVRLAIVIQIRTPAGDIARYIPLSIGLVDERVRVVLGVYIRPAGQTTAAECVEAVLLSMANVQPETEVAAATMARSWQ